MYKSLSLALLLSSVLWLGSAQAETQTFEAKETLTVQGYQSVQELEMLAYLRTIRQVQEQAGRHVFAFPRVQKVLSSEQATALAIALFKVDAFPLFKGKEIKAKLFVDTDILPEDLGAYLYKNPMMLDSIQSHREYILNLEKNLANYLERLAQADSPSAAEHLRQAMGVRLKNQYESNLRFVEGTQLFSRQRWKEAHDHLSQAIVLNPEYAANYLMRSITLFQDKQYDPALADLNQGLKVSPKNESLLFMRALVYIVQGALLQEGLNDLHQVIEINPLNAQAYYLRGHIYREKKQCSMAKRDFLKACDLGHKRSCQLDCNPQVNEKLFQDP